MGEEEKRRELNKEEGGIILTGFESHPLFDSLITYPRNIYHLQRSTLGRSLRTVVESPC